VKDSMLAERELVLHSVDTSSMLRFSLSRTCVQYSVQRVSRARCACVYRTAGLPLLAFFLVSPSCESSMSTATSSSRFPGSTPTTCTLLPCARAFSSSMHHKPRDGMPMGKFTDAGFRAMTSRADTPSVVRWNAKFSGCRTLHARKLMRSAKKDAFCAASSSFGRRCRLRS